METSDSPLQHNLFQESFRDAWTRLLESSTKFHVVTWGTLLLYLSSYYLSSLPGFIYQFIPAMKKYKIQQDKTETWEDQWKCFKMTFHHIFTVQIPMSLAVYFLVEYADLPCDWNSMPRWYSVIAQIFGCFLIEDTWEYFIHRLLHHRRLYQHLHKVHHAFKAPFSIQATYAGQAEILIFGTGFSLGMYIFCNHLFSVWLCTMARIVQNTHVHSGYDAPWDPLRWVPFAVTSRFHDFHHMNFYGNYAPVFTWWDWLFGTNKEYENYKAKRKQKEIKEDVN